MTGYIEYHVCQLKINYENLTESKNQFLIKKDLSLTGVIGDVSLLFDIFRIQNSYFYVSYEVKNLQVVRLAERFSFSTKRFLDHVVRSTP